MAVRGRGKVVKCDICGGVAVCECDYLTLDAATAKKTKHTTEVGGVIVCTAALCNECRTAVRVPLGTGTALKNLCPEHTADFRRLRRKDNG